MEKSMSKNNMMIASIVAIVVVGGGAFYGGMVYAAHNITGARQARVGGAGGQFGGGAGGAGRGAGRGGANAGGGFATGEIISKDDTSVTVKMRDGGSKIIFYSGTTVVMKAVAGSAADLAVGQTVMSTGKGNTDGSVSAESIQIRPAMTTSATGGTGAGQ